MGKQTTAGATLQISLVAPATFDAAGYGTLFDGPPAKPVVGEITDFGEFGREYNEVTHNPVATRGTQKFKGSFNEGQMSLQMALDNEDLGQIDMKTALNLDDDAYFQVTLQNGDAYCFAAKVMSFKTVLSNVDSMTNASCMLSLTTTAGGVGIVEIPAA
ncbi:hypothetical protein [Limnobacter alexandrii]|uniref:hypothetical protein n=1 Tax=Limnobacter alexandrii TaxID=2570352 RepID=UPI0011080BAD|nr:hypothetical protein [Limnobacter alexandrii]